MLLLVLHLQTTVLLLRLIILVLWSTSLLMQIRELVRVMEPLRSITFVYGSKVKTLNAGTLTLDRISQ